jgi:probable FeS assembly SUF system protein SufT
MNGSEPIVLQRDVEAAVVPSGTRVALQAGETAYVTQALGGAYTVVVNGNMFRIDGKDADALGLAPLPQAPGSPQRSAAAEPLEKRVWDAMRTCYDPEIPVNIVDLGLIYDCRIWPPADERGARVDVKMTLTAPGCGMGPVLQQDVQHRLLALDGVEEVNVELVWDPPWNHSLMTDAAKLQLGLM